MIRGLYTSAMGMSKDERRLEVISNNLANINTNGYKKDTPITSSFSEVMTEVIGSGANSDQNKIGKMSLGVGINDVATDYKQGSLIKTDNPLDAAILNSDNAFFAVDVPSSNGNTEMYTRDGAFTLNDKGQLVTKDGNIVKGQNGPIAITGTDVTINSDGTIVQNGNIIDKLLIKEFADTKNLRKQGNNLIIDTGNTETRDFSGQIMQGNLESSNVNSISEMVEMINIMRSYEANQKVLQAHDQTLQKAVNDVGRI